MVGTHKVHIMLCTIKIMKWNSCKRQSIISVKWATINHSLRVPEYKKNTVGKFSARAHAKYRGPEKCLTLKWKWINKKNKLLKTWCFFICFYKETKVQSHFFRIWAGLNLSEKIVKKGRSKKGQTWNWFQDQVFDRNAIYRWPNDFHGKKNGLKPEAMISHIRKKPS